MDEQAWRDYALHIRGVLEHVGVDVPACMPGEPEECGYDLPHHALGYAAALQAKAEHGLYHLHHGDPEGSRLAAELLAHWRGQFRAEPCRDE